MTGATLTANAAAPNLFDRVRAIHWGLVALVTAIALISCVLLYSAGGGKMQPWADKQIQRFACLYTSKVSNFISYPPNKYFQSPIDLMPHDV